MVCEVPDHLAGRTTGIIGAGHLGLALAEMVLDSGFPRESLRISYGGRASTLEKIRNAGLEETLAGNEEICLSSDLIFIAVRPQSYKSLKGLPFNDRSLVVSCMAGVSTSSLRDELGIKVHRIMPSGPGTFKEKKGIVAAYHQSDLLPSFLSHIGMRVYELPDEEMMHYFTAGVCLPAALIAAEVRGIDIGSAIDALEKEYGDLREIYHWARDVLPELNSDEDKDRYIRNMSTKGGITEAIVSSIHSGGSFHDALRRGIARSRELSSRL